MILEAAKDWPSILQFGTGDTITEAEVEKRYRQVAKKAHPDAGGSNEAMTQVNLAKQLALAWVAKERDKVAVQQVVVRQNPFQQQAQWANQQASSQQFNSAYNAFGQSGIGGLGYFANVAHGQSKADWVRNLFRSSK